MTHHADASFEITSREAVPDSATGELAGLRGEGRSRVAPDGAHSLALDHTLD